MKNKDRLIQSFFFLKKLVSLLFELQLDLSRSTRSLIIFLCSSFMKFNSVGIMPPTALIYFLLGFVFKFSYVYYAILLC